MHRLLAAALAVATFAVSGQDAHAEDGKIDGRFDVGGRSIRLACQGSGEPVVVIDAGMGTAPVEDPGWQGIAAKIAPVTQVCLYDRAGLGSSDPAPNLPRTSLDAAADLRTALQKAGLPGPYLLAGHSIGGLHAQVFANRYPADTAGLILVSSTHPDQMTTWLALLPPPAPGEELPITDTRVFLTDILGDPTKNEERLDVGASFAQARGLKTLGAKPVVVATHSPASAWCRAWRNRWRSSWKPPRSACRNSSSPCP